MVFKVGGVGWKSKDTLESRVFAIGMGTFYVFKKSLFLTKIG